jgi:hypothetical protein
MERIGEGDRINRKVLRRERLFRLAKPYLEKNDLGVSHTERVLSIAVKNFTIPNELDEVVFASIILHDVGGSDVKDQYERGPEIAKHLLRQLDYDEVTIREVCEIIRTHHNHPKNPTEAFRILHDSDKLAMLSPEEFSRYNSRPGFRWSKVLDSMYTERAKSLAQKLLHRRMAEVDEVNAEP